MSSELIVPEKETALEIFTSGKIDPIIAEVRELVNNFPHDLSTGVSRKRTASLSSKVSKYKTQIDACGKELVADWKAKSKAVDESRKKLRDELDDLRDEARKPLTDWENKEKERVKVITEKIEEIKELSLILLRELNASMQSLKDAETILKATVIDSSFEEYEFEATKELKKSIEAVDVLIKNKQELLDQAAELKRLKDEQLLREKKEYEENLKKEAAEKAKLEAEEKAKIEKERIEKEKQDAVKREEEAKIQAKESERKQIEAEERAKIEKEQAEQRRIEAEELAKKQKEEAVEKSKQDQIQAQKDKEYSDKLERKKREANIAHKGNIMRQAKECLMKIVDEETAKKIVIAIDRSKIRNIVINY